LFERGFSIEAFEEVDDGSEVGMLSIISANLLFLNKASGFIPTNSIE
jgi:hypothetical protein